MSTGTDSELLAVVASKVDDLRADVAQLSDAVTEGVETKAAVSHLTSRVVDLEDAQRWLTRTVAGAVVVAILGAVIALPV